MVTLTGSEPLITAMMPAFNEEAVIGEAIAGLLAQTYANWELVIIDDGSTDGTGRVVAGFSDPRIRYFHQSNQGRAAARNAALRAARGEFIAIADADDISVRDRFERQVAYFRQHPEIGIVAGQMLYFSEDFSPRWLLRYPETRDAIHARFGRGVMGIAHATALIRREVFDAVGPYAEECRQAQDLELLLRAAGRFAFASLPDVLVHYRNDPRRLMLRDWIRTTQYIHYAQYRHLRWKAGAPAKRFASWRRNPFRWPRWITYDLLRYFHFMRICKRLNDPAALPHPL